MKSLLNYNTLSIIFTTISIFVWSCNSEPDPINESEIITTLRYTLISPKGDSVVLSFRDLDGDGGNNPVQFVSGPLNANSEYSGTLDLSNESVNPTESITDEITNESTEHQFFFKQSTNLNISFQYSDMDSNGKPLGILSKANTGTTSSGKLLIILRHLPDKNALKVSSGDITNAGGETDIEVEFNIEVK